MGSTANSHSTIHIIHAKEFTVEDFSCEHLFEWTEQAEGSSITYNAMYWLENTLAQLNHARHLYLNTKNKDYWWVMIQLLPTSYNQKRTVTLTYENLLSMLKQRKAHKLDEWREFCDWIFTLPNSHILREGVRE